MSPKLLHIASDCVRGGAERVFSATISLTAQSKCFDIFVASCDDVDSLPIPLPQSHFLKLDDWSLYPRFIGAFKYLFNLRNFLLLKRFLFHIQPDIIHVQNYLSRLSPSILFAIKSYKAAFPKARLIYTQHGYAPCPNGGFYNYSKQAICKECINVSKLRIAWKNCDRRGWIYSLLKALRSPFYQGRLLHEKDLFDTIICVGEFQLQKHKEDGFPASKLVKLTNPIDFSFYNPHVSLESKQNLLIFYGRISPEKNIPLLIQAFCSLIQIQRFKDYKLLIIGDGDDKQHCKNLATTLLKKPSNITFLGHLSHSEIKSHLSKAKLSITPSLMNETFGLTIVESMLCGTPSLTPALPELSTTARHCGGFIFHDLAQSLQEILDDYEKLFLSFLHKRSYVIKELEKEPYLDGLKKIYGI